MNYYTVLNTLEEARSQIDALESAAQNSKLILLWPKRGCAGPLSMKILLSRFGYTLKISLHHTDRFGGGAPCTGNTTYHKEEKVQKLNKGSAI